MTNQDGRPFTCEGLDHIVLKVRDTGRAAEFYCTVLGAREERKIESIGMVQLRVGNSLIDIVPLQPGAEVGAPNMEHFALAVSPFDGAAIADYLKSHGIEPGEVAERYGAQGYGPSIYIKDPDGNTVELKGPARRGV